VEAACLAALDFKQQEGVNMEKSEFQQLLAEMERTTHAARSASVLTFQITLWTLIGSAVIALGALSGFQGFGAFLQFAGCVAILVGGIRGLALSHEEYALSGRGGGPEKTNRIAELSLNEGERFEWEKAGKPDLRAWVDAGRPPLKKWLDEQ
jgi:hypothetical protein